MNEELSYVHLLALLPSIIIFMVYMLYRMKFGDSTSLLVVAFILSIGIVRVVFQMKYEMIFYTPFTIFMYMLTSIVVDLAKRAETHLRIASLCFALDMVLLAILTAVLLSTFIYPQT